MQNLYRHYDANGELLYVGVSLSALVRLAQHKQISDWFPQIAKVSIEKFDTREAALNAETLAIRNENPKHNIRKKFPKVPFTNKDFDELKLTRQVITYKPMYALNEAADVLNVSTTTIKKLIDEKKLSCVLLGYRGKNPIKKITGWQLIDYINNLEAA